MKQINKRKLIILVSSATVFTAVLTVALIIAFGGKNKGEHSCEYGSWVETVSATCTTDGEEKRTCSCGEYQTRSVTAKGHSIASASSNIFRFSLWMFSIMATSAVEVSSAAKI